MIHRSSPVAWQAVLHQTRNLPLARMVPLRLANPFQWLISLVRQESLEIHHSQIGRSLVSFTARVHFRPFIPRPSTSESIHDIAYSSSLQDTPESHLLPYSPPYNIFSTSFTSHNAAHIQATQHHSSMFSMPEIVLNPFLSHELASTPSSSVLPQGMETYSCQWTRKDGTICGEQITLSTISHHLATHGVRHLSSESRLLCRWEGCMKGMKRESIVRHIRETHLGLRRTLGQRDQDRDSNRNPAESSSNSAHDITPTPEPAPEALTFPAAAAPGGAPPSGARVLA